MGKYDLRPCLIVLDTVTYKWKEAEADRRALPA